MRTQDFVIGKWAEMFKHYGLPPVTGKNHYKGECPLCNTKTSFRIDDKERKGSDMDNRCICPLCSEDAEAGDMKYTAGKVCIYAFIAPPAMTGWNSA